jgi:hypothetical protein
VIGGKLFPTVGFRPYRWWNLWNPGINAGREYMQGIVGGVVGLPQAGLCE